MIYPHQVRQEKNPNGQLPVTGATWVFYDLILTLINPGGGGGALRAIYNFFS